MASVKDAKERLKDIDAHISRLTGQIALINRELTELGQERQKMKRYLEISPSVSDHALIRYMERKLKLNLDDLRAEILTPDREEAIRNGATKIKVDNLEFVVKDGVIVTILK